MTNVLVIFQWVGERVNNSSTGRGLLAGIGRRLDAFVPRAFPQASEDAARARIAAGIALLMAIVFAILAATHLFARHFDESAINATLALLIAAAPFLMRFKGHYGFVVNKTLTLTVLAMALIAVRERGAGINAATVALAEVPLFATLLAGIRTGAIWLGLSCAVNTAIGIWVPLAGGSVTDRLNDYVVLVIVTGTLFLVAVLYEHGRARQLRQIADLESQKHAAELGKVRSNSDARVAQAERFASLGRVAGAVAHELNNPLSYVLGNLEFLSERLEAGAVPAEFRPPIADAVDGAERMKHVVADLYRFTRPTDSVGGAGDVGAAISAALKLADTYLRSKASVTVNLGNLPPVLAETSRMTQAFLNLLINAAQAMPEGRAGENRVNVRAHRHNERVLIEIEDTGEGLPPDVIQQTTSAQSSARPSGHGLGLGLVLTYTIVESSGGKLEFDSRPGKTIARVWLSVSVPLSQSDIARGQTAVSVPARSNENPPPGKSTPDEVRRDRETSASPTAESALAVLIVDDEAAVAQALARVLRGHRVSIVNSGREALQLLDTGRQFDVVLCDVMMPDLAGMDVYDAVEKNYPQWLARFVFMTGGTFTARAKAFHERIPNKFLAKPIAAASLRAAIQETAAKARPSNDRPALAGMENSKG